MDEFSPKEFEELCRIMCTKKEICLVSGKTQEELEDFCQTQYGHGLDESYDVFTSVGKTSLRRAQYRNAVDKGSDVMLIWLGKNSLGQSDSQQTGNVSGTINIISDVKKTDVPVGKASDAEAK